MNYEKLLEFTHKIGIRTSENVFRLPPEEKAVLYALTKEGPKILSDISAKTSNNGDWEIPTRWALKRRINGTDTYLGLIPYEYLQKRKHSRRIRGKDGEIFCLTTKGMLASLSTKISLEKSYLFKKYIELIKNILNRKIVHIGDSKNINTYLDKQTKSWLLDIFRNYIRYQIYTFLIWQEANAINLQRRKNFDWYFMKFFEEDITDINWKFPQDVDSSHLEEYRTILRQNKMYSKIIQSLDQAYEIKTTKKNEQKIEALRQNLAMVGQYVINWYKYFDKFQLVGEINKQYSVKPIPHVMPEKPIMGIDIEYLGKQGHKKLIKPDLNEAVINSIKQGVGLEGLIPKERLNQDKKLKMLTYRTIPS